MVRRAGPAADLATVDCDLSAIVNSIQLSRFALAKVSQQGAARDEAYQRELHKNQLMSEELKQLRDVLESVHKALLEANATNEDLHNSAAHLTSMLDELEQVCLMDQVLRDDWR